jgi:hypothetical protein
MSKVVILTLWNKSDYVQEAIASVKAQTRKCLHICTQDEGNWTGRYPPAVFYNERCSLTPADAYISWLSDDDLLMPTYAEYLAGMLDAYPEYDCVWGGCTHVTHEPPKPDRVLRVLPADGNMNQEYSEVNLPLFKIDWGQFMIRRTALDKIEYPYIPEAVNEDTRRCDGLLMNKIARAVKMNPSGKMVKICRTTPVSNHTRVVNGVLKAVDWQTRQELYTAQL